MSGYSCLFKGENGNPETPGGNDLIGCKILFLKVPLEVVTILFNFIVELQFQKLQLLKGTGHLW